MDMMDTQLLELRLTQCESKEEYEALAREHAHLYVSWKEHVLELLAETGLTYRMIAEGCDVSIGTARNFVKKIPARRESVIMLAMMMGMGIEETNNLLTRWARFQKLYPRNPNDAIWLFLISRGGSMHPSADFQKYYGIYEQMRQEYCGQEKNDIMDTQIVFEQLVDQHDSLPMEQEFRDLIRQVLPAFQDGYKKLLDYINSFFYDIELADNQRLGLGNGGKKKKLSPNECFQDDASWKDAYYRKIHSLTQNQIMPSRAFLIALGLRLTMTAEQINHLLDLAGMGPLCPKDPLESMFVFLLEELNCMFPSYFYDHQVGQLAGTFDLMDYSAELEKQRVQSNSDAVPFDIPDISLDFEDNPVESLYDYVRRYIQENAAVSCGYDDYLRELFPQVDV